MRWFGLAFLFFTAFAAFVLARFPLEAALSLTGARSHGVEYISAFGTVWNGSMVDASIAGQDIGVIRTRTEPASLLTGRARMVVTVDGAGIRGDGVLEGTLGGRLILRDAEASVDVSRLEALHPRLRAPEGRFALMLNRLVVDNEGCIEADGILQSDALARLPADEVWTGPPLSGVVTCQGRDIAFSLSGSQADGAINATALVSPEGRADVRVEVRTDNLEFAALAGLFGFVEQEGAYIFTRQTGLAFGGGAG